MPGRNWIAALAAVIVLAGRAQAAEIHVAVAANMQQAMTTSLIPAFEKMTGDTVTPTYGSTKLLATQIENGAPIDVFVAADTATIAKLAGSGYILKSTPFVYAVGRLVIWTRADRSRAPKSIEDLADAGYAKVAIANPALAPYGEAAIESLTKVGILSRVQPKIVQADNIAEALAYAKSGNADVALTALSLVIDDKTDPYVIVPDSLYAPIDQAAGLVAAGAGNAEAQRFLDFLRGREARKILTRYGYGLPGKHTAKIVSRPTRIRPAAPRQIPNFG